METMRRIEETVLSWHEKVPHLSGRARTWLADNCWWLTLIIVVIGIMTVAGILTMAVLAGLFLMGVAGIVGGVAGSIIMLFVALVMTLTIINAVLLALAISPLRRKERRGWQLLFAVALLSVIAAVVKMLFDYDFGSLVVTVLLSAGAGYLLFEIRDRFTAATVASTVAGESRSHS